MTPHTQAEEVWVESLCFPAVIRKAEEGPVLWSRFSSCWCLKGCLVLLLLPFLEVTGVVLGYRSRGAGGDSGVEPPHVHQMFWHRSCFSLRHFCTLLSVTL